jgi:hypothetical protein
LINQLPTARNQAWLVFFWANVAQMPLPLELSARAQAIDLTLKIRKFLNAPQRGLSVVAIASRATDIDVFNIGANL